jgi:molybdopterin-biosynthesis enzyme MoeA-like protein
MNVLKEQDARRREKLARLQRDFRITMFQVRETELETRMEELEDEKEELVWEHEEAVRWWKSRCAEFTAEAEAKTLELAAEEEERNKIEVGVRIFNKMDLFTHA